MIKYLDLKAINDMHDAELRAAVNRVMDSGWYLKGEATRLFESHYAEYIGTTAIEVDNHNGAGARGDGCLDKCIVNLQGVE